jgi:hypothetical protein
MSNVAVFLAVVLANAFVFGVIAYAVFWMGHSGWWFLLLFPLQMTASLKS